MSEISNIPDKPQNLINSKSIVGYSYDANAYVLDVFYQGRKQSIYRYFMVYPPVMSQIFDSSGSMGSKAYNLLKEYRSTKLR